MALSQNQLDTYFQNQLGRPATPYEYSLYSGSDLQRIANIGNEYKSLNTDQSIVDYLKFQGQDSSLQNRQKLGQQYGITNVGSAEGNIALMKALKGGSSQSTTTSPVGGSVSGAAQGLSNDQTGVPGSISGATVGSTSTDPVTDALNQYKTAQSKVADIDNTLAGLLSAKKDEVARSGGIVDEAQLKSIVYAEQKPLLDMRKQLVGEQTQANSYYKDVLAQQKEMLAEQKQAESGWKMSKMNITDAAGNVLGQKLVWSQNPAARGSGVGTQHDNSTQYVQSSSGSGGMSSSGHTTLGNTTDMPKLSVTDGADPSQVLQSLISGKPVPIKGSTIPVSQQSLYSWAIDSMLGIPLSSGGRIPSGAMIAVENKKIDIENAYGLTEGDVAIARQQAVGMTTANTAVLQRAAFTSASAFTANAALQNALDQSKLVPRGGAKLGNKYKQWVQGNFTPAGNLAALETYIYTASREYAKVTSGGAASSTGLTDTASAKADELISAAQSPDVFATVVKAMQKDMTNVTAGLDKQTTNFPSEIKSLYGLALGGGQGGGQGGKSSARGSMDARAFVEQTLTSHGLKYNDVISQYTPNLQQGEKLALDNTTGDIIAVTSSDDPSSYTPL